MKVTKEMTDRLGIRSMTIRTEEGDAACCLVRIKEGLWYIRHTPSLVSDMNGRECPFVIGTSGDSLDGTVIVRGQDGDTLVTEPPVGGEGMGVIVKRLSEYERNEDYERRQEKRVKVGIDGAPAFGLKAPEQYVLTESGELPCVIVDVSVHGVQLLMESCRALASSPILRLKVSFSSPADEIIMSLNKVYAHGKEAGGKVWSYVSCQILEPVHFVWRERVLAMLRTA